MEFKYRGMSEKIEKALEARTRRSRQRGKKVY
jgi:hypothetical protein